MEIETLRESYKEFLKYLVAMDPPSFIADRPFLFVIANDEADSILFMGGDGDMVVMSMETYEKKLAKASEFRCFSC